MHTPNKSFFVRKVSVLIRLEIAGVIFRRFAQYRLQHLTGKLVVADLGGCRIVVAKNAETLFIGAGCCCFWLDAFPSHVSPQHGALAGGLDWAQIQYLRVFRNSWRVGIATGKRPAKKRNRQLWLRLGVKRRPVQLCPNLSQQPVLRVHEQRCQLISSISINNHAGHFHL